jgi:LemA protein
MAAETPHQKAEADNMLSGTLKSLFAVAEAYPELKANENFLSLQRDLSDTEDKIAYSRQFYNSNVMQYNTKTKLFPSVVVANLFNFREAEFFETDEAGRQEIEVSFDKTAPAQEK